MDGAVTNVRFIFSTYRLHQVSNAHPPLNDVAGSVGSFLTF